MSVLSNKAASSPVISAGAVSLQMVSFQCCNDIYTQIRTHMDI